MKTRRNLRTTPDNVVIRAASDGPSKNWKWVGKRIGEGEQRDTDADGGGGPTAQT